MILKNILWYVYRPRGLFLFVSCYPMPRREPFVAEQYYHVYNRWLDKQTIFFADKDYQRFLWYMHNHIEQYQDAIGLVAYCLLPNHFHFVIEAKQEGFALSQFVGKVCASYGKYLWAKYGMQWEGKTIFESRFKSKQLSDERYLQQCIYYVEHNPLKHQLVDRIDQRAWRSESWVSAWSDVLMMDWEF